MKVTDEMIRRVKELADELFYDYEIVGIRVQEVPFSLGEMDHCSHIWDVERTPAKSSPEYPLSVLAKLNLRKIISAIILL